MYKKPCYKIFTTEFFKDVKSFRFDENFYFIKEFLEEKTVILLLFFLFVLFYIASKGVLIFLN